MDRVVDALEDRDVDHPARVAGDDHAGRRELGHRPVAALGDRLGAPGDALAALEDPAHELGGLELLQQVVAGDGGVGVVQADDEADRHAVVAHRVDPRAAELLVLGAVAQRPAQRVDDAVELARDLPDLLDPERPHLGLAAGGEVELADRGAGQMAPGALGQHGGLGGDVGAGLEVAQRVAVLAAALVAGADAAHDAVLDEQLRGGGLGEDVGAGLLGLLGQPARQLGDRDDVVAVVAERRRRRLERQGPVGAQHPVDRVLVDLAVGRPVLGLEVGEELLQARRAHHRAREVVGAADLALLDRPPPAPRRGAP